MRHFLRWSSLALLCLGLLLVGSYIQAQDGEEDATPQYVGANECSTCHRDIARPIIAFCEEADACHRNALVTINDTNRQTAVFADFSQGEDLRTVLFPGDEEPRPFLSTDIHLVQGSRYVQRYIYEQGPNQYAVLPAQWNISTETWEPFTMGEEWPTDYDWGTNCAGCHTTGLNVETMEWVDDGVQCEACHGPGYEHTEMALDLPRRASTEDLDAVRAAIYIGPDPQICGQCHSQGRPMEGDYHYPVNYIPGNDLLEVFNLFEQDNTDYWWASGHGRQSNMQYNEWLPSGHAMALEGLRTSDNAADECLACHSTDYYWNQKVIEAFETGYWEGEAPEPITVDDAQYGITCISCHRVHTEDPTTDYYIVEEPYALCTSCHSDPDPSNGLHAATQQLFEGITAIENVAGIPSGHFAAEDGPDCMSCHMPRVPIDSFTLASHALHIVDPAFEIEELDDSCTTCHGEQADGPAMSTLIDDIQSGTAARLEAAKAALEENEEAPEWVGLALQFVEQEGSLGVHNYAYTDALLDAVEAELNVTLEGTHE